MARNSQGADDTGLSDATDPADITDVDTSAVENEMDELSWDDGDEDGDDSTAEPAEPETTAPADDEAGEHLGALAEAEALRPGVRQVLERAEIDAGRRLGRVVAQPTPPMTARKAWTWTLSNRPAWA